MRAVGLRLSTPTLHCLLRSMHMQALKLTVSGLVAAWLHIAVGVCSCSGLLQVTGLMGVICVPSAVFCAVVGNRRRSLPGS